MSRLFEKKHIQKKILFINYFSHSIELYIILQFYILVLQINDSLLSTNSFSRKLNSSNLYINYR
jgi:hypothetical protein